MKTAAFLVDTGSDVGLGHLRRSGVLLDAMAQAGFECRLFCADPAAAAIGGRAADAMPISPTDLSATGVIVCDSYRLDAAFIASLRARCGVLLAFDDTAERSLDVDFVLNHNIYGGALDYSARTHGQVLAGPACALVDRAILAAAEDYRRNPAPNDVVISFGGTDDGARGAEVATALLPRCKAHIHLIVAPGRNPAGEAVTLAETQPVRVTLHRGPNMAALLSRARVYIGGAGVTALEALVIGLDLVLVVIAPNQRLNAEAMARTGQATIAADAPESIAAAAASVLGKPRVAHPRLIDGLGPSRVIAAIEQLLKTKGRV